MPTVRLTLPHHAYDIVIDPGVLNRLGELARSVVPHDRAAMLYDQAVVDNHAAAASGSLTHAGYGMVGASLKASEKDKSLDTVARLYDVLLDNHMERRSPVFAVGGGITGDVAGFVAASYLRGVPFVQCPTTLLAMVDASVGGKTGVNVPQGKNLVGAFHQPAMVCIDTDTLATLPAVEVRCGLAECVKHGVIRDPALFTWIEDHVDAILELDSQAMVELVQRNVAIKAAVVEQDEKESGVRAHLNFGHTFAHAIEATGHASGDSYSGYKHGEAVALGMVAATRLAVDAGRCDAELLDRLMALLYRIGLPTHSSRLADTPALMRVMRSDKKVKDGTVRLVLPDAMGRVSIVSDTPESAVAHAWDAIRD